MRGKLTFDVDHCKGCRLCVEVCPVHILALDEKRVNKIGYTPAYVMDESKCVACANCVVMCPDSIITLERIDS